MMHLMTELTIQDIIKVSKNLINDDSNDIILYNKSISLDANMQLDVGYNLYNKYISRGYFLNTNNFRPAGALVSADDILSYIELNEADINNKLYSYNSFYNLLLNEFNNGDIIYHERLDRVITRIDNKLYLMNSNFNYNKSVACNTELVLYLNLRTWYIDGYEVLNIKKIEHTNNTYLIDTGREFYSIINI